MASAIVDNVASIRPESFLDFLHPDSTTSSSASCGRLRPRISFSLDFSEDDNNNICVRTSTSTKIMPSLRDFEFRPEDPQSMLLPADELIFDGKLLPLHVGPCRSQPAHVDPEIECISSIEDPVVSDSTADLSAVSTKARRCSSRWKELLRLKKVAAKTQTTDPNAMIPSYRGLRHFLNPKSFTSMYSYSSINFPLLQDSDSNADLDLIATSSRPSPSPSPEPQVSKSRNMPLPDDPHARVGRNQFRRAPGATVPPRCASVDSPRMSSSGKIVFQGLGRSSSSPSSFNGAPRMKYRGVDRSYSAGMRITPVLNVPVCSLGKSKSLFGLVPLFSQQKREASNRSWTSVGSGDSSN